MALIGWSLNDYKKDTPLPESDLLCNMAGNAFSCFALWPILSASFSALGFMRELEEAKRVGQAGHASCVG
eukprot:11018094-Alexandrium_andersonii.AAC.1